MLVGQEQNKGGAKKVELIDLSVEVGGTWVEDVDDSSHKLTGRFYCAMSWLESIGFYSVFKSLEYFHGHIFLLMARPA